MNINIWRKNLEVLQNIVKCSLNVLSLICEDYYITILVAIMFYAWPFNLWLFAYFPLQRERQILWRILAANLLYKMKIQCGGRRVYICFDSCLEIKWLHLERCPSSRFLVPISFSPYPRSLVTILPKSSAHRSPPVAFPPLRGGSAASLMTFISCPNTVCATHIGETGLGLVRIFIKAKQSPRQFWDFQHTLYEGISVQMNLDLNYFSQRSMNFTEGKFSNWPYHYKQI